MMKVVKKVIYPESLRVLGFTLHFDATHQTSFLLPPLCSIPAGEFTVGSDPTIDSKAQPDEWPQHTLWLPSYTVGKYPVTVAEYAYAVEANATNVGKANGMSAQLWQRQLTHLTNPIYGLTWYDTQEYVYWLARMSGQNWRLLTEAEWEKAARGTDGRIYPWGNHWEENNANVLTDYGQEIKGTTTQVDKYRHAASPYSVVDMVGNVQEWTSTIYNRNDFPYPYIRTDGREEQEKGDNGDVRVLRGGCWLLTADKARCTSRNSFEVHDRFDWLHGLRIARYETD